MAGDAPEEGDDVVEPPGQETGEAAPRARDLEADHPPAGPDYSAQLARYPTQLGSRQIRGPVSEAFNWLHFVVVWLLFSPVALLLQSLPEREVRWKVADP